MSTFDNENVEQGQPGYAAPVSAVKRQPTFTNDESLIPAGAGRRNRAVRQARDGAQYTRQQKGHSILLHLLLGAPILWINVFYISLSPNHYWHA